MSLLISWTPAELWYRMGLCSHSLEASFLHPVSPVLPLGELPGRNSLAHFMQGCLSFWQSTKGADYFPAWAQLCPAGRRRLVHLSKHQLRLCYPGYTPVTLLTCLYTQRLGPLEGYTSPQWADNLVRLSSRSAWGH